MSSARQVFVRTYAEPRTGSQHWRGLLSRGPAETAYHRRRTELLADLVCHRSSIAAPDLSAHTRHNYVEQDLCGNAALAGQGVAKLNHIFFAEELASGRLIAPFNQYCTDDIGIWLVHPESRRNTPKIKAFREWVVQAVAADMQRTEPKPASN